MTRIRHTYVDRALELAAELRPRVLQRLASAYGPASLRSLAEALTAATATELSDDDFADLVSQSLACGTAVTALASPLFHDGRVRDWILEQAHPLWKGILEESFALSLGQDARHESVETRDSDPILAF